TMSLAAVAPMAAPSGTSTAGSGVPARNASWRALCQSGRVSRSRWPLAIRLRSIQRFARELEPDVGGRREGILGARAAGTDRFARRVADDERRERRRGAHHSVSRAPGEAEHGLQVHLELGNPGSGGDLQAPLAQHLVLLGTGLFFSAHCYSSA